MCPKRTKDDTRISQGWPKMTQNELRMTRTQDDPRLLQDEDALRRLQVDFRRAQRCPRMTPWWPQDDQRWQKDDPGITKNDTRMTPGWPKDDWRWLHDVPKWPKDDPRIFYHLMFKNFLWNSITFYGVLGKLNTCHMCIHFNFTLSRFKIFHLGVT